MPPHLLAALNKYTRPSGKLSARFTLLRFNGSLVEVVAVMCDAGSVCGIRLGDETKRFFCVVERLL